MESKAPEQMEKGSALAEAWTAPNQSPISAEGAFVLVSALSSVCLGFLLQGEPAPTGVLWRLVNQRLLRAV